MMNRPRRQRLLRGRGMIHVHISIFNNPSTNTSEPSRGEGERSKVQRAAATGGQVGVGVVQVGVGVVQVITFRNMKAPLRPAGAPDHHKDGSWAG